MIRFYIIGMLLLTHLAFAQVPSGKETEGKGRFYVGGGLCLSSIDFYRNEQDRIPKTGVNAKFQWDADAQTRLSIEWNHFSSFASPPRWESVKVTSVDFNVYRITDYVNNLPIRFYSLFGISYHYWNGFFTETPSELNRFYAADLAKNSWVHMEWLTGAAGLGMVRHFHYYDFYVDARFHFARTFNGFGISNMAYSAGFIYRLPEINVQAYFKKIYRNGLRKRYDIDPVASP